MPISGLFNLVYTSIREENTKTSNRSAVKSYSGEISVFGDGNGDPKFTFDNYGDSRFGKRPKLLIKTFETQHQVDCLRYLKYSLDQGINDFKNSPFPFAAPIGYGTFDKSAQSFLEIGGQDNVPFMVYVFREDSDDLQKLISQDNVDDIILGKGNFDYNRSNAIALKLFNLFGLLENLKLQYEKCEQYQILHYDIKAANYIVDEEDNIFIVDLDQSGLYDLAERKFIYKPSCDLTMYESSIFLPYEILTQRDDSKSRIDKERWNIKERHSETWMAWMLIYRVLTGFQSPFFFLRTTDHAKIYDFIKTNKITDLFSNSTFEMGDLLNCYAKDNAIQKTEFLKNISNHFDHAVSESLKSMMNQVFINGFYEFNLRPTFFKLSKEYNLE